MSVCFEENKHIIYYWWNDNPNIKPHQDLKSPVILSIATLRSFHKNVPVTIFDISDFERPKEDWKDFQNILNFDVVKTTTDLNTSSPRYWKLCSKIADISKNIQFLKEDNIVFVDSDIFFLQQIFPLKYEEQLDKNFYCYPHNTGFFYFNKNLESNKEIFELWANTINKCLIDEDFFTEVCLKINDYSTKSLHDEISLRYLIKEKKINNIKNLDISESFVFNQTQIYAANYGRIDSENFLKLKHKIKFIHAMLIYNGPKRGLLCLIIEELKQAISKSLNAELIKKIFRNDIVIPSYNIDLIIKMSHKQLYCLLN